MPRLVGVNFRPVLGQLRFQETELNTPLTFRRDPENEYDFNAIEVHSGDEMIGFIDRQTAAEYAFQLDTGATLTGYLTSKTKWGGELYLQLE
jgi:hypothetical protein